MRTQLTGLRARERVNHLLPLNAPYMKSTRTEPRIAMIQVCRLQKFWSPT